MLGERILGVSRLRGGYPEDSCWEVNPDVLRSQIRATSYPFHLPPVLRYQEHYLKECCMIRTFCQTRNKYEQCPTELPISENQRLSESEGPVPVSDPTELRFVLTS